MNTLNVTIERFPYRDKSIDVILDISTSDHVPLASFCGVIEDFARILTDRGELLMIFNNRLPGTPRLTEIADYWFTEEEVKEAMSEYFNIELIKPYGTGRNRLKHYLLKAVKN